MAEHGLTTTVEESRGTVLGKPIKGLVFVVLWILAIGAWITGPFMVDPNAGAFFIDLGVILASAGFAALFLERSRSLIVLIVWVALAIAFVAVGDFLGLTWLSIMVRLGAPLLAINQALAYGIGRMRFLPVA